MACMKRVLCIILMSMLFPAASFGGETITVRSDEWMPFNGQPGDDQYPGFAVEIMKTIFEEKGYVIDYQVMPWTRSLVSVRDGTYDAVIAATQGEAKGFVFPEEPLYTLSADTFYVLKDTDWQYNGIDSLLRVRLGVIAEYEYSDRLIAYIKNFEKTERIRVEYGDSAHLNMIRSLLEGYVDVIVDSPSVFSWEIRRWKISADAFKSAGVGEQRRWPIYIAFSPNRETSRAYAQIFDSGMRKLKESGRLKELLRKYMLDN